MIGEGGTARVYLCRHERETAFVAIKVAHGTQIRDSAGARFAREAAIGTTLDHPHVARVLDHGVTLDGDPFLVMPYYMGPTLRDALRREGRLPWPLVCSLGAALGGALDHLHQRGIVHRDVKPGNVILERSSAGWSPRLIDLGAASATRSSRTDLTPIGFAVGTRGYLAREVRLGEPAEAPSDVYALGVLLYESLTGIRPPIDDAPVPIHHLASEVVPRRLEVLVRGMLEPRAADRPSVLSAWRLLAELALLDTAESGGLSHELDAASVTPGSEPPTMRRRVEAFG